MRIFCKNVFTLLMICILCSACSSNKTISFDQNNEKFKKLSTKEQVEIVHLENLKHYLNKDAKDVSYAFSENYLDFFRSQKEKKAEVNEKYFEELFKTDFFKACTKFKLEELVDINKKQVLSYDEITKMNPKFVGLNNLVGFKYEEGDILIKYPPKEGSPMMNGWNAVYRKENDLWKIIAGNF